MTLKIITQDGAVYEFTDPIISEAKIVKGVKQGFDYLIMKEKGVTILFPAETINNSVIQIIE